MAQRVTNFDSDLRDGLALAALLVSHWPELASFVSQLKLSTGNQAGMRSNAGTLVKMMEEVQLPWTLQVPFCCLFMCVKLASMGVQNRLSTAGKRPVLHADAGRCAVLCCAVLRCAVLCCAVCHAELCRPMLLYKKVHCDMMCDKDVLCMLSTGGGDHQTRLKRYGAAGALPVPDLTPVRP